VTTLEAIHGDITRLSVDAIVNAANRSLMGGGGVDGAIHRAGGRVILEECMQWVVENGPLPTGKAMITSGGRLPARHVIHTVGPIWSDHTHNDHADLLASCYRESLDLARQNACRSVAFPSIATGAYGFPIDLASEIAVTTVRDWVDTNPGDLGRVVFVCFSGTDLAVYEGVLGTGSSR
jgi:O-acetyl-ADP-ribose deacetylase (regulator of RNase III)